MKTRKALTVEGTLGKCFESLEVPRLTVAQVKVADKANGSVAIAQVLALLMGQGCIVTLDAMGGQKQIVSPIYDPQAEYGVTVKGNQPTLQRTLQANIQPKVL